ncbi:LamG-like jellyroll fold domain-containing protein [Aeoliella mucimassa]|uniref:Alginate lyase n=1 Tax=Aeoliella mucimassa TaxID=2527972 RepID=A0A518APV4_9BACT|nr:LamG-like jellyroll fold domain-containing protein [Aeoliella mucimassa]QDU56753.1 Alginate lyase [Aeoliella mucimassa]
MSSPLHSLFLLCLWLASTQAFAIEPTSPPAFNHPGLLHTEDDFARMRSKLADNQQPWLAGWQVLEQSRHAQLNWQPRPTETIVRGGPGQNFPVLFNDMHATYCLALRWKVSGDKAYADKAVEILNGWSSTLKHIRGNSDRFLAAGIYGYQFANAAEIMRTYPGWSHDDFGRFQQMMLEVFYPMNHQFLTEHNEAAITNYWANWDLCNIASIQAIGVLCDRRDLYDEAMQYLFHGRGNGALDKAIYYVHPGNLGQWQEAGRDQGHSTLGIALLGPICETAWHQGDDLYGYRNNRFLAGAEYVAKYNLNQPVPYVPYAWGTGQRGDHREQATISDNGRGNLRAGYELVVNHYVHRLGIAAPYSSQYAAKLRPEPGAGGHASTFDQPGFGTLTATIDPQVASPRPSGLTARLRSHNVELSWWGAANSTSYQLSRATQPEGPFNVIASDIHDPLTYTDSNLPRGTYYYYVEAIVEGVPVSRSEVVCLSTAPTLVSRYEFDEHRESQADSPSYVMHGAKLVAGLSGQAVALDGVDDYVELPTGVVSQLSDFTIACWVQVDEQATWSRVFDFGDDRGFSMYLTPSNANGKCSFAVSTVYYHNEQVVESPSPLPLHRWVHVAVTLSDRTATLYVDGQAVAVRDDIHFPPYRLGNTSQNWIGRSQYSDPYLTGKVDDFRIYHGALSPSEIEMLLKTR